MAKKSILADFSKNDINKLAVNNQIENIHYTKIKPANKNRQLRRIEELAEDIAEDGLENCLTVRKIEDADYEVELIAGERRYTAICYNIDHGDKRYEYIPCKVVILSDLDARKRLILNNHQNDPLTSAEKLDAVEELKEIYKIKKESGEKIPGRIQSIIADELGLQKSQIGNYEKIIKNAVPEIRELIEEGEITISAAAELSSLDDEEQLKFVENGDDFDIKTIKEYKKDLEDIDEEEHEEIPVVEIPNSKKERLTIKECIINIENMYQELYQKVGGVEWREEEPYLVMAMESFKNFEEKMFDK